MIHKVHKTVDFVISLILWILIGVLVVPLVLILFLYKSCLIFIAKRVDKHLHPTQPNDTYFSVGDTTKVPIVNVAQIWRVDGVLDKDEFKDLFQRLFLSCPESRTDYFNLYCYLEQFGGYVFKKSVEQIDIDKHIVVRDLGDDCTLERFIVDWMVKEEFPEKRPLWEIVLVYLPVHPNDDKYYDKRRKNHDEEMKSNQANNNDDNEDNEKDKATQFETVVMLKMHHCLTDGYGFIHIVDKLTGNEAPYLVVEDEETLLQKLEASFFGPKTLLDYVIKVAGTPDVFYPLKDRENANWYMSLNTLNLKKLKSVRRRTKTHFISVMMSLTIGALRRYLTENSKNAKAVSIPSHIWTANSLPWPNHPRTKLVNHWTGGVFQVPFKTDDALERLYGTEQFFKFFHDTQMHKTVKRLIIPVTWCLPSALLRFGHSLDLYYFRYSNAFASLLLSEKPHYLLGKRVTQLYLPLGIKDAVSTSVLFGVSSSHSGQIDMSLLASSELVPDQAALDKIANVYFAQELDQMCRSAENRIIPMLESVDSQKYTTEKLPSSSTETIICTDTIPDNIMHKG